MPKPDTPDKPDKPSPDVTVETTEKAPTTVAEMFKKQREEAEKYDIVEKFSIFVMPQGAEVPFPYSGIPDPLFQCAQTVIQATGASDQGPLLVVRVLCHGECIHGPKMCNGCR